LVGGTALKLLHVVAGVALLLAGGGIGWAALSSQPAAEPPAVPKQSVEKPAARDNALLLDGDGRALPDGAILRLGSRRYRAEGRNDLAIPTPDGKYVLIHPHPGLSAYAAQGLMLLDLETGLRVRSFEQSHRVSKCGSYEAIRPAVFSPDGKKLYALAWDKSEEKGDRFYVWAYTDNACKRVLLVWDVDTGKLTDEWDLPAGDMFGASLIGLNVSPDGKRLYVYGAVRMEVAPDRAIRGVHGLHVVDASNGKVLSTWDDAGNPAGFTARGKEVITFRRGAPITVHDAESGKAIRTFELDGLIPSVAVTADGKTVAGVGIKKQPDKSITCELKLWEIESGKETGALTVDGKDVSNFSAHLAFSEDGKTLYLGAGSGRILAWDLAKKEQRAVWKGHEGMIHDMCLRPGKNDLVSAGSWDGAISRWDATTGKRLSKMDAYVGELTVARTPDGKGMVAVDAAGKLDLWDLNTGKIIKTLETPGRKRQELLFTPDGKHLVIAAEKGPNTVWDLATGKKVDEFEPPPKKDANADEYWWGLLGFSPDGKKLVASKFGRGTWMWTWPDRKLLWHEAGEVEAFYFKDDNTLVSANWSKGVSFHDVQTGAMKLSVNGPGVAHIVFSTDFKRMVTCELDGAWRLRDGENGRVLKETKAFKYAWCAAFSPSGWLLAVVGDNSVRVYDTATWQEVARFEGHEGTVHDVFFANDSTLVSASPEDATALVWSLKPSVGREPPDLAKLWADLAGDGPAIRRAVWASAQHPDVAVKLFREKWPISDKPLDADNVRKLLDKLDSGEFDVREAAEAELSKLGRQVEDELRRAVAETKSAEVKERAGRVLAKLATMDTAEYSAEEARELRAVWALELAGNPEAKKLLEAWSKAKVGNRLSEASAAALKRMRRNDK
jgi:WD40 repeat protein